MRPLFCWLVLASLVACDSPSATRPFASSAPSSDVLPVEIPESWLLPDLETVVPQHLNLVNSQGRDLLRFSNGVANTGQGPLHVEPAFPLAGEEQNQGAIQKVFDIHGDVAWSEEVSEFEYHPEHNHWHISAVAEYSVRSGSPTGTEVGGSATKVTFCLIDWIKLEGNSRTKDRTYWACDRTAPYQGISAGWIDQYHHSLPDQEVDISGVPEGVYYLVSTANPDHLFLETSTENNTAWVKFSLSRGRSGNGKVEILETSPCSGRLCGSSPNR